VVVVAKLEQEVEGEIWVAEEKCAGFGRLGAGVLRAFFVCC